MKTTRKQLGTVPIVLPTDEWNSIIDRCYDLYCSADARKLASTRASPKLHNLLVQLHDFSSVVEAKRSMKAGDIGRLLIVWKKWCIMSQSMKKITNYSS